MAGIKLISSVWIQSSIVTFEKVGTGAVLNVRISASSFSWGLLRDDIFTSEFATQTKRALKLFVINWSLTHS